MSALSMVALSPLAMVGLCPATAIGRAVCSGGRRPDHRAPPFPCHKQQGMPLRGDVVCRKRRRPCQGGEGDYRERQRPYVISTIARKR